jgi:hypothetical protein
MVGTSIMVDVEGKKMGSTECGLVTKKLIFLGYSVSLLLRCCYDMDIGGF